MGTPVIEKSTDYLITFHDRGKAAIIHEAIDISPRTFTFDSNVNQHWTTGTMITIDNQYGAGAITISTVGGDVIQIVGAAGITGSRTLASGGQTIARFSVINGIHTWRLTQSAELT